MLIKASITLVNRNDVINNTRLILDALNNSKGKLHLFVLVVTLTLGLGLRLYALLMGQGYHYFAINDEIYAYRVALAFLAGEDKAQYIGQPVFSGGSAPGPGWTLFWVLLYKLGGNSVNGAYLIMTLINAGVIFLVHRLALQFVNPKYALLATFLFATSPWPVYYAIGVWNPTPMALWGVLLFITLWNVSQQRKSRQIFWVCVLSALIPHFHMIGVFYIPAILLILYLSPAKLNSRWFAIGIAASIAIYMPYMIGEMNNNWENTKNIFSKDIRRSYGTVKIISTPINVLSNHTGRITGDTIEEFKSFGDAYFGSYIILVILNLISIVLCLIFFTSLIYKFIRSLENHWKPTKAAFIESPEIMFLGILLVFPSMLFMLTGHNYGTRYSIIAFSLLFVLPAIYLAQLKYGMKKRIIAATLAFTMTVNFYLIFSLFKHQNDLIENGDFYLASFNSMESIRQILKSDAGNSALITLDTTKYIEDAPEKHYVNGIAISAYIRIHEQYVAHSEKPSEIITYKAYKTSKETANNHVLLYKNNGLLIVRELVGQ